MDATLTEDEELLAETAARLAAGLPPGSGVEDEGVDDGTADRRWRALVESGFPGMRLGPANQGASTVEVAVCAEAFGRVASPAPLTGSLLAAELLALGEVDQAAVEELVAGPGPVVVALDASLQDVWRRNDEAGARGVAFDAVGATSAVAVSVDDDGGVTRWLVEVGVERLPAADLSRTWRPAGPGGSPYGRAISATDLDRWRSFALVVLAADMVGAMDGALTMAVEYAKERRQFKRPIGSFQAVQHLCAEQLVSVEAARSATYYAAWAVDGADPRAGLVAAQVAKAYVGRVGRQVGEAVLQVHGGIGQTWECDAHRFLRRLLADRAILGDEAFLEQRLAEHLAAGNPWAGGR